MNWQNGRARLGGWLGHIWQHYQARGEQEMLSSGRQRIMSSRLPIRLFDRPKAIARCSMTLLPAPWSTAKR